MQTFATGLALFFCTAIFSMGCSSGGTLGNMGSTSCTVTVSGAATASYSSCVVTASYNATNNVSGIEVSLGSGTADQLTLGVETTQGSSFATGSFSASNTVLGAVVYQHVSSGQTWIAAAHDNSTADQGAYTVVISSTGTEVDSQGSKAWLNPSGGFAATLEPQSCSGASGVVTVQVSFNGGSAPSVPSGNPASGGSCVSGNAGGNGGGSAGSGGSGGNDGGNAGSAGGGTGGGSGGGSGGGGTVESGDGGPVGGSYATGKSPSAMAITPNGKYAYVLNQETSTNVGNYTVGTVSEFSVDAPSGHLTPLATGQTGICKTYTGSDPGNCIVTESDPNGISISADGAFAYVTNAGTGTISEFTINASTGVLSSLNTGVSGQCVGSFSDDEPDPENCLAAYAVSGALQFSADHTHAYAFNAGNSLDGAETLEEFSVNTSTGILAPLNNQTSACNIDGSNTMLTNCIGAGKYPSAMVVTPDGKWVYAANDSDNTISEYSISASTGALVAIATGTTGICVTWPGSGSDPGNCIATGAMPSAFTLSPNGKILYVLNSGDANVASYSINDSTGVLSIAPQSFGSGCATFKSGSNPLNCFGVTSDVQSLGMGPAGNVLYANLASGSVLEFSVDSSGSLLPLAMNSSTCMVNGGSNCETIGGSVSAIVFAPGGNFAYALDAADNKVVQLGIGSDGALLP